MGKLIKKVMAKALALYCILVPLIFDVATAQGRSSHGPPSHSRGWNTDLFPGTPIRLNAPLQEISGDNGFRALSGVGIFKHIGHAHKGGVTEIMSPWGETMVLRHWRTAHGIAIEIDAEIVVALEMDIVGPPSRMTVNHRGGQSESTHLGSRVDGPFEPNGADATVAASILETVATLHSVEFLTGLAEFSDFAQPVGCSGDAIICAGTILLFAAAIAAVGSACLVGGAVVLTTPCIIAAIGYLGSGTAAYGSCVNFLENCVPTGNNNGVDHNGGPLDDGCTSPGDIPP